MKRILLLLLTITCVNSAFSQVFTKPNNSYGTIWNRSRYDSTLFYPTGCGAPSLRSTDQHMSALYFDSCNNRMYVYNPSLLTWDTTHIGGGTGAGIDTLNNLTAKKQTFATGTSGTDFNISSSGSTHTFNMPDASATARGLITGGTQTIGGNKTFGGTVSVAYLYVGSTSAGSYTDSILVKDDITGEIKRINTNSFISPAQLAAYNYALNGITLSAGTSTYSLPAGKLLEKVEIIEPTSIAVDIGTTMGDDNIASAISVGLGYANYTFNYYNNTGSSQTIYFSNYTGSTVTKLYIR